MTAAGRRFPGVDAVVYCSDPKRADRPAKFKIAAWWQGGDVRDLKTFGFADEACVERLFRAAAIRAAAIPLASGERIESVGIYDLAPGVPASQLRRRTDLESRFSGPPQYDPLIEA